MICSLLIPNTSTPLLIIQKTVFGTEWYQNVGISMFERGTPLLIYDAIDGRDERNFHVAQRISHDGYLNLEKLRVEFSIHIPSFTAYGPQMAEYNGVILVLSKSLISTLNNYKQH
jgi:hypothetical protein